MPWNLSAIMKRVTEIALFGLMSVLCLWMVGCASAPKDVPSLMAWDVEASNRYVPAGDTSTQMVHLDIEAQKPPGEQQRIPLNLSLVLDHSGSMNGTQMEDAKQAVLYMLRQLHPEDTVSVIAFSSEVKVLQSQEFWEDVDRLELNAKIADLGPTGTTAMQEALGKAIQQVRQKFKGDRINRVMLLSDGIPNDASSLLNMAQNARSGQIGISTFGLGPYYNEDLMAQIADTAGGNYHFIKDSGQIEEFFLAEKRSLEQVIARNVSLTVQFGPGVQLVQALGGKAQVSGRRVTMFLGDFGLSDKRQIGLKLQVSAPASGAKVELIDAKMQWEDVVYWSGKAKRSIYLEAESTRDQALIDENQNKVIGEKVGRLTAAWELDRAMREFQAGEKKKAQERLRRAASQYKEELKAARSQAPQAYEFEGAPVKATLSSGSAYSIDLEEAADDLEDEEPESDKGKILIKKNLQNSRKASGL